MSTFLLIILFTIYLVNVTTSEKEDCPVVEKTAAAWCKGIEDIFKQDNGQFSKYACGCIEAILTHNFNTCKANEYDFSQTPKCGKLLKSEEFEKLSKTANPFTDLFVNVIFKHMFNVCDDKSVEEIDKFVKSLYVDKTVIALIEGTYKLVFSSEKANVFIDCYREAQTLVAQQ